MKNRSNAWSRIFAANALFSIIFWGEGNWQGKGENLIIHFENFKGE